MFDGGETGMSVPDSVCSQRSVSVGRDPTDLDPQHAAAIAAHYMGHALGLSHDDNSKDKLLSIFICFPFLMISH